MGGVIKSAAILSLAGIITKIMGAVYRIPFARMVGDEGLGLYQMAYPFYTIVLAISTAGVPVAISKLVAEHEGLGDKGGAIRIFWVALGFLFFTGLISSFCLYSYADELALKILGEPRAVLPIRSIAPAIFFTSIMSAFRGFFQGQQNMIPTALSQILEQTVRIVTVFWAALFLLPLGIEVTAAGATFGAATGGLAGLLVLVMIFVRQTDSRHSASPRNTKSSLARILFKVLVFSIPISLGGLIFPLMQMLDISLVPMGLQKGGYTVAEATSLYGQLSGMAGSIINLPTIVTIALSASLVPAVSSLVKKKKIEVLADLTSAALKLNLIITLPATIGLMILAEPISGLLFALPEAGEPLAWLAGGIIFAGLYHVSTGILQGLGQTLLPVIALLTGSGVKVMITYYLTPLPQWGIKGAALATVLGFMVAAFINLLFLKYNVAVRIQWWKDIFFAALSVFLMAVSVVTGYAVMEQYFSAKFTTLLTIPLGAFVYLIFIFLFGLLKKREIAILLGEDNRWNNVLDKIPFLR